MQGTNFSFQVFPFNHSKLEERLLYLKFINQILQKDAYENTKAGVLSFLLRGSRNNKKKFDGPLICDYHDL